MADTTYPSHHGHNDTRIALVQHTSPDGGFHAVRLESRCDCAHNAAHCLARSASLTGCKSTVQTWSRGRPTAVETTDYPPSDWMVPDF